MRIITIKNINRNKKKNSLSAMMSRRNGNSQTFQSRRNGSRRNGSRRNGSDSLSLPLIQVGQLSVAGEIECALSTG